MYHSNAMKIMKT